MTIPNSVTVSADELAALLERAEAAEAQRDTLAEAPRKWPRDGSFHEPGCTVDPCDCFTAIARAALAGVAPLTEPDQGENEPLGGEEDPQDARTGSSGTTLASGSVSGVAPPEEQQQ